MGSHLLQEPDKCITHRSQIDHFMTIFIFPTAGSADPQPCPAGQYCQFDGLDSPTGNCTEGYYCSSRAKTATPTDGDTGNICPAGHYCPEGSGWPTSCSLGTYSPSTGNKKEQDCLACTTGEWCGDYNLTATSGVWVNQCL